MKIKTKLLTAVLATATAFSCALTAAAATTPTITLHGNEATPAVAADGETVTLSLKASGFNVVAGADLELTLGTGISLRVANVKISGETIDNNKYKVSGNTLRIIDVFNMTGAKQVTSLDLDITVNVGASDKIGRYDFSCTKAQLVYTDNKSKAIDVAVDSAKLVVGKKTETVTFGAENQNFDTSDSFLPYGILKSGDKYVVKNADGSFNVSGEQKITRFITPIDGAVTTFGASKSVFSGDESSIQFGSYINKIGTENNSFGTLLIVSRPLSGTIAGSYSQGTYENAVKYFDGNEQGLFANIIAKFNEKATEGKNWFDGKLHPYSYNRTEVVYAAVVSQKTYMWRDSDTDYSKLQYAVRCTGLNDDVKKAYEYTAVGYSLKGDTYTFSTEVKSASYNSIR